jgi:hypothetical protein
LETDHPRDVVVEVATRLRDAAVTPHEISIGRRSLEDLFFDLTGTEEPV